MVKLIHLHGGIVGAVHPVPLEEEAHVVWTELLDVIQGKDLVFDALHNDLVDPLQVHVVELHVPGLLHFPGDHTNNPVGFILMNVYPSPGQGHLLPVAQVKDFSNLALSSGKQKLDEDLRAHPMSVADGVPAQLDSGQLGHNGHGDGDDVLSSGRGRDAMPRDGDDTKQEKIKNLLFMFYFFHYLT